MMACAEVYLVYTLIICEGHEENETAFTEKNIIKHYVWWVRDRTRDRE